MAHILDKIIAGTRRRLATSPPDRRALEQAITSLPAPPAALTSLCAPGVRVIAEIKRSSPSAGTIRTAVEPTAIATGYASAGAAAISVLTEPDHFGGSLQDLEAVAASVAVPCLRKDFIVDEVQLLEARAAGASLALLIVAALDDATLLRLRLATEALGLVALVEAHTAREVERAVGCGARVIGVNNRDLATFDIDLATCERLRPGIPDGVVAVAESGVETAADIRRLRGSGYEVFLVGSSLMRAQDPAAALAALVAA